MLYSSWLLLEQLVYDNIINGAHFGNLSLMYHRDRYCLTRMYQGQTLSLLSYILDYLNINCPNWIIKAHVLSWSSPRFLAAGPCFSFCELFWPLGYVKCLWLCCGHVGLLWGCDTHCVICWPLGLCLGLLIPICFGRWACLNVCDYVAAVWAFLRGVTPIVFYVGRWAYVWGYIP